MDLLLRLFIMVEMGRKQNNQEAESLLKRMVRTPNELNKTGNPKNGADKERGQLWS